MFAHEGFTQITQIPGGAMSQEKNTNEGTDPSLQSIDFGTFLLSLSTSALVHMGEVADPNLIGEEVSLDLELAKQTIDIIGMLKEKTKNNLTSEEENLINHLLYDLRLRYVQKTKR
jgi:hypothetical protein